MNRNMLRLAAPLAALFTTLAALLGAGTAMADSRIVFGLHFGVPLYGYGYGPHPYYYPAYPPYYYYPPPVYYPPSVIYAPPPTIESRPPPAAAAPAPADPSYSWHYCAESRGYYPYVRECPGGWQRVPAVPPLEK